MPSKYNQIWHLVASLLTSITFPLTYFGGGGLRANFWREREVACRFDTKTRVEKHWLYWPPGQKHKSSSF